VRSREVFKKRVKDEKKKTASIGNLARQVGMTREREGNRGPVKTRVKNFCQGENPQRVRNRGKGGDALITKMKRGCSVGGKRIARPRTFKRGHKIQKGRTRAMHSKKTQKRGKRTSAGKLLEVKRL